MLNIKINNTRPLVILCLGAHSDDIEIGCGGTIISILEKYKNVKVYWIVFSSEKARENEARNSANIFLRHAASKSIRIEKFRNGFFPYIGAEIKDYFESLKETISPDIIFTHYREDLHQDHRVISELTWNTFRNHLILEYEILKYDGDIGAPSVFVSLTHLICKQKIDNILKYFKSQNDKHWFKKEVFLSIMRIRGMECASPTNYAEAFYCRKIVLE